MNRVGGGGGGWPKHVDTTKCSASAGATGALREERSLSSLWGLGFRV